MTRFNAPKAIASHPGVEVCEDAVAEGFEDYRYAVWLKAGWVFRYGRTEGCRTGVFNTVADFRYAEPVTAERYAELRDRA